MSKHSSGFTRERVCEVCGRNGYFELDKVLVVTPKVRRVFRDAGVTSFDWLPIRVEDGNG